MAMEEILSSIDLSLANLVTEIEEAGDKIAGRLEAIDNKIDAEIDALHRIADVLERIEEAYKAE